VAVSFRKGRQYKRALEQVVTVMLEIVTGDVVVKSYPGERVAVGTVLDDPWARANDPERLKSSQSSKTQQLNELKRTDSESGGVWI